MTKDDVPVFEDLEAIRDWLVEKGHITEAEKDTIALNVCRTDDVALVASSGPTGTPEEGREMADSVNKVEIRGVVKWEPRKFDPKEEGQKTILVFAIEWERPKSEKRSVFHVKTFGDLADELVKEKLDQGDTVLVSGSLNETKWKDKKTEEWVNRVEVWANKVEIEERTSGDDSGGDFGGGETPDAEDDDIPF